MVLLDQIKTFIDSLETKTFYYYILGYILACTLLFGVTIFYYYSSTRTLQQKIKSINSTRADDVLEILTEAARVKQQQTIVEEILSKDIDFKIAGYFIELLEKHNLTDKETKTGEVTSTDLENNYRKNELSTHFEDMTMQELTELLQDLEKNPRIVTDRLEITKSKKKPKTIEVNLTISTLLPKVEVTSI